MQSVESKTDIIANNEQTSYPYCYVFSLQHMTSNQWLILFFSCFSPLLNY